MCYGKQFRNRYFLFHFVIDMIVAVSSFILTVEAKKSCLMNKRQDLTDFTLYDYVV